MVTVKKECQMPVNGIYLRDLLKHPPGFKATRGTISGSKVTRTYLANLSVV